MSGMVWEKGYQEENLQKQKTREEDKDRNWEAGSSYVSDEHLAGTPGTPQAKERALGVSPGRAIERSSRWKIIRHLLNRRWGIVW